MHLDSAAFSAGGSIPIRFSEDGEGVPPPLAWSDVPSGTREFALICDRPDSGAAVPRVYWLVYKLPGPTRELEGGSAPGVVGQNDFRACRYHPLDSVHDQGVHLYRFRVFALGHELPDEPDLTGPRIIELMKGHILAVGTLVGHYGWRKSHPRPGGRREP